MDNVSKNLATHLFVDARTPDSILFQGEASSVFSVNNKGPFDILPLHANFISLIKDRLIISTLNGQKQEFSIDVGILKVYKNQVNVFIGVNL